MKKVINPHPHTVTPLQLDTLTLAGINLTFDKKQVVIIRHPHTVTPLHLDTHTLAGINLTFDMKKVIHPQPHTVTPLHSHSGWYQSYLL